MSLFPTINNISDLLPHIKDYDEIKVVYHESTIIVSYMINTPNIFNDPWTRECRGITFDLDGNILSRPLHKFFNIGERVETFPVNISWQDLDYVNDKLDGSMISVYRLGDRLVAKTKKTAVSPQAQAAQYFINNDLNYQSFCHNVIDRNCTPIFEYTDPKFPIVIAYGKPMLTLLAVRENISGEYWSLDDLQHLPSEIPVVPIMNFDYITQKDELLDVAQMEGYVFVMKDGERYKAKTKWYRDLHKSIVFVTERNVAEMVADNIFDDYIANVRLAGYSQEHIEKVMKIQKQVIDIMLSYEVIVTDILEQYGDLTPKEFAIKYKKHNLFSLLMPKYRGKIISYGDFFKKYEMKSLFSLEVV